MLDSACIDVEYVKQFRLLLVSNMHWKLAHHISKIAHIANVPVLFLKTAGFIGFVQLQHQNGQIYQAATEEDPAELSVLSPFPNLQVEISMVFNREMY